MFRQHLVSDGCHRAVGGFDDDAARDALRVRFFVDDTAQCGGNEPVTRDAPQLIVSDMVTTVEILHRFALDIRVLEQVGDIEALFVVKRAIDVGDSEDFRTVLM